jgi:phosphoserine/homoserine phosphotransferase
MEPAMYRKPTIVAMDLEGVLVPEVWIAVAEKTGIEKLRLTTRDISDYDELMRMRISILREQGLTLRDVQDVIATMDPLPGASDFIDWVRREAQVVILSDTFYEFALPLMKKLAYPTLFCNSIEADETNSIVDYHLRISDGKRKAVEAFKAIHFRVVAVGDSYNDTTMLSSADLGILFRPPDNVIEEFPQFSVCHEYDALKDSIADYIQT